MSRGVPPVRIRVQRLPHSNGLPLPINEVYTDAPLMGETPLSDALPTRACGNALALDSEAEAGICSECDGK